jgi:putative membrane protein
MSGMLLPPLLCQKLTKSARSPEQQEILSYLATYDRWVVGPALLGVWVLGSVMATQAGWWTQGWFWLKLAIAFTLSGIHGALSGRRKRCLADRNLVLNGGGVSLLVGLGLLLAVGLVIHKPMHH